MSSSSPQDHLPFHQLIVFDFDWSLVDQDTDRYLFEVLDPSLRLLLVERKRTLQWTDNVADCLDQLAKRGFTEAQINQAFSTLPLHPAMKRAIEALSKPITLSGTQDAHPKRIDTQFLILSNSNSIFIELVLKHHNLFEIFKGSIITNPAHWDSENPNRIVLRRKVDPNGPPHACSLGCSPNMCKGAELAAYLEHMNGSKSFDRIAYVGDGDNDYCPLAKVLSKNDYALVRAHKELPRRINQEKERGNHLSCNVIQWEGAWQIEQIFSNLLSA